MGNPLSDPILRITVHCLVYWGFPLQRQPSLGEVLESCLEPTSLFGPQEIMCAWLANRGASFLLLACLYRSPLPVRKAQRPDPQVHPIIRHLSKEYDSHYL